MTLKHTWLAVAVAAIAAAACAEATHACGGGEAVTVNGSSYCVYKQNIVIVGGFDCPASMPYRRDFERATVCGDHGFDDIDVAEDICARVFVPCTEPAQSDAGPPPVSCRDQVCDLPHAASACVRGECTIASCDEGFGDCDADADNGCETSLHDDPASCGACGWRCAIACCADGHCGQCTTEQTACLEDGTCTLPGAEGFCSFVTLGPCAIARCLPGFFDCNATPADGCESNRPCECRPRVEICDRQDNDCDERIDEDCEAYTADAGTCPPGLADCNEDATDGCETALNTDGNCGTCAEYCALGCVVVDVDTEPACRQPME